MDHQIQFLDIYPDRDSTEFIRGKGLPSKNDVIFSEKRHFSYEIYLPLNKKLRPN